MRKAFNYKHLYYFWVVGREGGMARAATRLDMTVQTISAQVRALEKDLGYALLKPDGRGLALTDAGVAALHQADQIFQLGEALPSTVRDAVAMTALRLTVGISDGLPKLVVRKLLEPVIAEPNLHLVCHEGELDDLLGDLALHRLDLVFSDRPAPGNKNLKLYTHPLQSSTVGWYGCKELAKAGQGRFPDCLSDLPVLLPTSHNAMRLRVDHWLQGRGLRPRIAGEFEDSALLSTFGASGMGVFPASTLVHDEMLTQFGLHMLGLCDGVQEDFYAMGADKKIRHPLVRKLVPI